MNRRFRFSARTALTTLLATGAACTLAACSGGIDVPGAPEAQEDTAVQGNASPAASPSENNPEGTVVNLEGIKAVEDVQAIDDSVAVRSGDTLLVGTADELKANKAQKVTIPTECGLMSPSAKGFVLGCGKEVLIVDPANPTAPEKIAVNEEFSVTAAALVQSGELFVGSKDAPEVSMYKDGKKAENYTVGAPSDQLMAVAHDGHPDGVVRVNRADTTIQNLDWGEAREGGRLRVGVALGQMAVGTKGVILVSDTGGKRITVYTASDAVRLHQYGVVDGTPWAVAWDPQRNLAWTTATDKNTAQAFDISTGAPKPKGQVRTIADAQHMAVTSSGALVIGSATADKLQIVTNPTLNG